MQISHACPACSHGVRLEDIETLGVLTCPSCGAGMTVPADAFATAGGATGEKGARRLTRCLVCPSIDLFVRKDFPQRLGVGIVVAGLAASCVTWAMRELFATFAILFVTALIDVVLYFVVPNCISCYRCGARYRGQGADGFGPFDLETHERHRQQVARVNEFSAQRPSPPSGG
ncbi:MAG: hypothetical protein DWH79_07065 [Planctomycetota bacterium]|nr:MAG: hypothetical protein DWH79_07065 [Planctomycetota bacterium]